jgi:hypothetical protein
MTVDVVKLSQVALPLFEACEQSSDVQGNAELLRANFRDFPELKMYQGKSGVYFLTDGEYCRIGSSTDLKQRISSHIGSNPRPLRILRIWCGSTILENLLKALLYSFYVNGEWFCIPENVIEAVCSIGSADDFEGIVAAGKQFGVEVRWSKEGTNCQHDLNVRAAL